jgi:transcriptional regulator with XRE-family HTH domain
MGGIILLNKDEKDKDEKDCQALLSRNIKIFRKRLALSQAHLALELGLSTTFLCDIETGKRWVSAQTLSNIAKALKIEIHELFRPEQGIKEDIAASVAMYLDNVDAALIKSVENVVMPAVKQSISRMRRYYTKEQIQRAKSK